VAPETAAGSETLGVVTMREDDCVIAANWYR